MDFFMPIPQRTSSAISSLGHASSSADSATWRAAEQYSCRKN